MTIGNCSPALFVNNIEISKNFYKDILKIPVHLDFGKNIIFKNGFAIWEINPNHIISIEIGKDKINDESVSRFELYFETDNLQQIFLNLKEKEVVFLHEIHEESWGQRTIRFFDPDKHLIEIGESMELFINRLFKSGLSLEEVSKKSHVPLDEVKRLVMK